MRKKIFQGMKSAVLVSLVLFTVTAIQVKAFDSPEHSWQVKKKNGAIFGNVFDDSNRDGYLTYWREDGLQDVVVYVDVNNDGKRDKDEPYAHTDRHGNYGIYPLPRSQHTVRQEVAFGYTNQAPSDGGDDSSGDVSINIIGGDLVRPGEYPFMVSVDPLSGPEQHQHFCGGVLLTNRFVLTAAHCSTVTAEPQDATVLVGTTNAFDGSGKMLNVRNITIHPEYIDVAAGFDVAVWELESPIDLEAMGLQTVDMLNEFDSFLAQEGVLATTLGWGSEDRGSPSDLQDVHTPVFNSEQCEAVYEGASNFETQICAAAVEGGLMPAREIAAARC